MERGEAGEGMYGEMRGTGADEGGEADDDDAMVAADDDGAPIKKEQDDEDENGEIDTGLDAGTAVEGVVPAVGSAIDTRCVFVVRNHRPPISACVKKDLKT